MPDHKTSPPAKVHQAPPKVLGRQIAIGFGLIAVISVGMCLMLLSQITGVESVVERMRGDERASHAGLRLMIEVREQYVHIANSLLEADRSQLEQYELQRQRLIDDAREISSDAPPSLKERVRVVQQSSQEMDRLFREVLLPAAERGDLERYALDQQRVEKLAASAALAADALAQEVEREMVGMHEEAERTVRAAIALGVMCILAVLGVAIVSTLRLRAAVLRPLGALTVAAGRFGRGEFGHRVGTVGSGELQQLGNVFDLMAEELAVREAQLLAKERMAAIGRLAAGVAHEINNPIGIIRGYLKTMLRESPSPQLGEELIVLDEEAAACQRLTGDLLEYAQAPRIIVSQVEMRELLEASAQRLRESVQVGTHPIVVRAQSGTIGADAERLRQVLANLVANAAQASEPEQAIEIVGERRSDGGYVISVIDSGAGVEERDKTQIFEPFFSKRSGGSGLGLSVCSGIVAAHGGTIAVSNVADGGTAFTVRLPRTPPQSPRMERAPQDGAPEEGESRP